MYANKIIVIHPGSQNLRIGLSSDLNPITILHAVAHRIRLESGQPYHDSLIPKGQKDADFDSTHSQVVQSLTSYMATELQSRGIKHSKNSSTLKQVAAYNKQSVPEIINPLKQESEEENPEIKKIKLEEEHKVEIEEETLSKDILFDQDILKLSDADQYNIHFPIRRGELNIHQGIGGSLQSQLANMEAIWLYAIHKRMGIDPKLLSQYNAVLVVSDTYNRTHLREMVSLVLQRIGFRACFLIQDHVAATFGSGLSYACVVDLGDQKCSISCVEDGISQADTRVRFSYGGGDITQVLLTILKKYCSFPYKTCDINQCMSDAMLLQHLKEENCNFNVLSRGSTQEITFDVKQGKKLLRYSLLMGDERLIAPLGWFYPELMNVTGKQKPVRIQLRASQQPDVEDCFDAEYIRETGRRNGRDQLLLDGSSIMPMTGGDVGDDDLIVDDVTDKDVYSKYDAKEEIIYMPNGQILSLDQAIVRSIERCNTDELKRKMYNSILLAGGSVKLSGFAPFLEKKISLHLNSNSLGRTGGDSAQPCEVNVIFKEMDPNIVCWKGACIMSCLESAPELWIYGGEWIKFGMKILREKAPFIW